ncbi:MAG: hypothetical protein ACTSXX_03465 [Candidatus Baldrarchaeia archaeon]
MEEIAISRKTNNWADPRLMKLPDWSKKNVWRTLKLNVDRYGEVTASIWMRHDRWLGKVVIHENERVRFQITPNMPKLEYCFEIPSMQLASNLLEFSGLIYLDVKRDGFNCLFYPIYGKDGGFIVVPKTRTAVVSKGRIMDVMKRMPRYLRSKVMAVVEAGYIPVFEVWGSAVQEQYGVLTGITDKRRTEKVEKLKPGIHFELTHLLRRKGDIDEWDNYEHVSPEEREDIAADYGLPLVKRYGIIRVERGEVSEVIEETGLHGVPFPSEDNLREFLMKLMGTFEEVNKRLGNVTEGAVLHFDKNMYKLKAWSIMRHDLEVARGVPSEERVHKELSKVLLEVTILEAAKRFDDIVDSVYRYIEEDFRLSDRGKRLVRRVCADVVATELILATYRGEDPHEYMRKLAGLGIKSGLLMGCISRKIKECVTSVDFKRCVKSIRCG